jgi:hypothetical protein
MVIAVVILIAPVTLAQPNNDPTRNQSEQGKAQAISEEPPQQDPTFERDTPCLGGTFIEISCGEEASIRFAPYSGAFFYDHERSGKKQDVLSSFAPAPPPPNVCVPWSSLQALRIDQASERREPTTSIGWKDVLMQSLSFTTAMNLFRLATEPSTRRDLRGPFWKDYFKSVKSLRGWRDGDEFLVNYIGHPMEGAISGTILIHNDPKANQLRFGRDKRYWISRLKALGWATVVSTQFELGPFGEAAIGNVGMTPSEKSRHPAAYVDLVVTPLAGTAWLVGEDMLDRFLIRRVERRTTNRLVRAIFRAFFNPSRSFANSMRGHWWWHRDDRPLKEGGRGPTNLKAQEQ